MSLLRKMNKGLAAATGFEVRRARASKRSAPHPAAKAGKAGKAAGKSTPRKNASAATYRPPADPETDRLLKQPVFIMSPVRSGSTLLRLLLDGHSRLRAPHELHVRRLEVTPSTRLSKEAMEKLDLEPGDLEHLLWDRVLHRELVRSGKSVMVEKTPSNAFAWKRISTCWPDARYIFLLRHPASIAASWHEADPVKRDLEEATADALRYMKAVERAREGLAGLTVRYEDLTADPAAELQRICAFLEVPYEPEMLEYGDRASGNLQRGLGDWREKIRTGTVQPGRSLPEPSEIHESLHEICRSWGYLPGGEADSGRSGGAAGTGGAEGASASAASAATTPTAP